MEGLTLVGRAHGARKDWQAVVGVLATAEEACSSAVASAGANDHGGGEEAAAAVAKHPPAELYEVVARSLALAGKWEEAASAVRRLEVCMCVCARARAGLRKPGCHCRCGFVFFSLMVSCLKRVRGRVCGPFMLTLGVPVLLFSELELGKCVGFARQTSTRKFCENRSFHRLLLSV